MTMYHTRKAMTIGVSDDPRLQQQQGMMGQLGMGGPPPSNGKQDKLNLEAVEAFKKSQRRDMELGWNLLNVTSGNSQAARTARVLKIEVAQRLEDSLKLKQAFDDLMSKQLSDEENMVAFTAAPFLGDWRTMTRLGKKIEKMPGGLEQLHMMSLQLPIPDFTLIYDLCKHYKLNKQTPPKIEELEWHLFNVKKIRVKFKDVDCGQFEQKRQELMTEIHKQGDVVCSRFESENIADSHPFIVNNQGMGGCSKYSARSREADGRSVSGGELRGDSDDAERAVVGQENPRKRPRGDAVDERGDAAAGHAGTEPVDGMDIRYPICSENTRFYAYIQRAGECRIHHK